MSVLVRYSPRSLTSEQYQEVNGRVESEVGWPPEGLRYHVLFGSEGNLKVSEIWDSRERWEAWSQRLLPILQGAGVDLSTQPELMEVHREERF